MLAQENCRTVFAEPFDILGRVENALVFAAPADRDERHLGINELAERAAEVPIMALGSRIVTASCRATLADPSGR